MSQKVVIQANVKSDDEVSNCKVDILVPFHGQHDKVSRLLRSILSYTRSNPYHITLIDDASPNDTYIEELGPLCKSPGQGIMPQVSCIRLNKQVGFGGALLAGFQATELPWVMIMHSDCVIETYNWMSNLIIALKSLKPNKVKMISPRTNNPVCDDERFVGNKDSQIAHIMLNDGFLPLYCALCHRDLFKYSGGFIKSYPYCWYENEEFGWRMKNRGYKQAICGNSWVYHEGSCTVKSLLARKPKIKAIMEKNLHTCISDVQSFS